MSEQCKCELRGPVPVFFVARYFDAECGRELNAAIDEHLCAGRLKVVIDFSSCKVINSPGIGKLLEIVYKIGNDFAGTVILAGLDPLKRKVMLMATILPVAQEAATVEAALALLAG